MNYVRLIILCAVAMTGYHANISSLEFLPELMPLWVKPGIIPFLPSSMPTSDMVTREPKKHWSQIMLPVFNHYQGEDGGYIMLYTDSKACGVYAIDKNVYVAGIMRVKGSYQDKETPPRSFFDKEFVPYGYRLGQDMSQDADLQRLARLYFRYIFYLKNKNKDRWPNVWFGAAPAKWDPSLLAAAARS